MHNDSHEIRLSLTTPDGRTFTGAMTSDRALSDALEDACFDLLYMATADPERNTLTVTVRVSQEIA